MEEDGTATRARLKQSRLIRWLLSLAALTAAVLAFWPMDEREGRVPDDYALCRDAATPAVQPARCTEASDPNIGDAPIAPNLSANRPAETIRVTSETARVSSGRRFSDSPDRIPTRPQRVAFLTIAERCAAGMTGPETRCPSTAASRPGYASPRADADHVNGLAISGRVMTEEGLGIAGVTLVATPSPNAVADDRTDSFSRFLTESDSNGFYHFDDLADGDYAIQSARHLNYPSVRITAQAGVEFANLVLREAASYLVEGRVTSPWGEPLYRVSVLPVLLGQPGVKTDRSGFYRLRVSLPADAGRLALRFQAPGLHETNRYVAIPAGSGVAYLPAEALELDAVMAPVELTTNVIGAVTSTNGKALKGLQVELRPRDEAKRYQATTDADGVYEFPVITAPMDYVLRVHGAPSHKDLEKAVRIDRDSYRFDVEIEPFETGSLQGRIVNLDGAGVPDLDLAVRNKASVDPSGFVTTDETGTFRLTTLPAGETILASRAMPDFLVRGLSIDSGRETNARIVLDWGQHQLSGQVVDRHGHAVPASRVLLRWAYESDGISTSTTRRTASDSEGRFLFEELGPGPHWLEVDVPGFEKLAFDHDISRDGYNVTIRLN